MIAAPLEKKLAFSNLANFRKGESMIPEGLEWKSVDDILDDVASVGFNFIRM